MGARGWNAGDELALCSSFLELSTLPIWTRGGAASDCRPRDEARPISPGCRSFCGRHSKPDTHNGPVNGPVKVSVENRWNSSGKLVVPRQNCRDVLFIWSRAEERGACRPVDTALSFKSFRAILGRAFFYRSGRSPHWIKVKNPNAPTVKPRGGGGLGTVSESLCHPFTSAR
jgi:hypothetical protein